MAVRTGIAAGHVPSPCTSRTVLNSIELLGEAQKHTDEKLNALIQAQLETDEKVARLVEAVDRLVRFRGPNGQGGESSR